MPRYEFITTVTYCKFITVEADNKDDAYDIACETSNDEIIAVGDHDFNCEYNGEVENV